jgi:hypothetical protein
MVLMSERLLQLPTALATKQAYEPWVELVLYRAASWTVMELLQASNLCTPGLCKIFKKKRRTSQRLKKIAKAANQESTQNEGKFQT